MAIRGLFKHATMMVWLIILAAAKMGGGSSSNGGGGGGGGASISAAAERLRMGEDDDNAAAEISADAYYGIRRRLREFEADRVMELPGQPADHGSRSLLQYAGYVTVNQSAGRALFYWLVASPDSSRLSHPSKPPLVLWLNGGPGCSSMGYGGMEELGPFKIHPNGTGLYANPHAWTQVADMLFLESPAGVGYSYSNSSEDYTTSGDARTAADSLAFLIAWLERFPQYRERDLYITGESYAGHYVPQLAHAIHKYNVERSGSEERRRIHLKGFMVGNAVTDEESDKKGIIEYYWSHALISDETYEGLKKECVEKEGGGRGIRIGGGGGGGGGEAAESAQQQQRAEEEEEECEKWWDEAWQEIGNIDLHTIFTPVCLTPDPYQNLQLLLLLLQQIKTPSNRKNHQHQYHWKNPLRSGRTGYDPCTPNYADTYFNRADVQRALHANTSGQLKGPWTTCNYDILDNWKDRAETILPLYKELIEAGLRIWVYSGDEDAMVPVTGTRLWLKKLGLQITKRWYPWVLDGQVAGWTQIYKGLTFATVRGAGHEVPVLQPTRALRLFSSFLKGQPLPSAHHR